MDALVMNVRSACYADAIRAFRECLDALAGDAPYVVEIAEKLDGADLDSAIPEAPEVTGIRPPYDLADLTRIIDDPRLLPLARAIERVAPHLAWRDCYWYPEDVVGAGFARGHAYASLAGPGERVYPIADFSLGLFMIAPRTLYRDHHHAAPELYFNMTGPSGWRFGHGDWHDLDAGSLVWNEPMRVHATRVYDVPWLCVYCWTRDLDKSSFMVPSPDWAEVEAALAGG